MTVEAAPWFVAADVCEIPGFKKDRGNRSYQNAYRRLAADQLGMVVFPHHVPPQDDPICDCEVETIVPHHHTEPHLRSPGSWNQQTIMKTKSDNATVLQLFQYGVWTAGAGLEYTFAGNWSAKVEYLHVDLDFQDPNDAENFGADAEFDLVRGGINYRF